MKIYFKTRQDAREFASKANKKAPTTKDQMVNKWAVKL